MLTVLLRIEVLAFIHWVSKIYAASNQGRYNSKAWHSFNKQANVPRRLLNFFEGNQNCAFTATRVFISHIAIVSISIIDIHISIFTLHNFSYAHWKPTFQPSTACFNWGSQTLFEAWRLFNSDIISARPLFEVAFHARYLAHLTPPIGR